MKSNTEQRLNGAEGIELSVAARVGSFSLFIVINAVYALHRSNAQCTLLIEN